MNIKLYNEILFLKYLNHKYGKSNFIHCISKEEMMLSQINNKL